jgi:hypothetical protein
MNEANENKRLIVLPYRPVVTDLILNGAKFTTGFRTTQADELMLLGVYICFDEINTVESFHVELQLSDGETIEEFNNKFSGELVNLSFKDNDGGIGGFKVIRNPILF